MGRYQVRQAGLTGGIATAKSTRIGVRQMGGEAFEGGATIADALRRPGLVFGDIAPLLPEVSAEMGDRIAIEIKYEGYVRRQHLAVEKAAKSESVTIPESFAYGEIGALSREAREKLDRQRPRTLGAAGRISGVTPSDIAILSLYVRRHAAPAAAVP